MKKQHISKEILYDLYIIKKYSSLQIAAVLGDINSRTIRKKLKKYNIPRRTLSEALVKKKRNPFSNNLAEKAYLLGLRAGDFWARKKNNSVRVQTSTTHPGQIELLRNSLERYGDVCIYYYKNKTRLDEWFIYVDLNASFDFLVEKTTEIPAWILEHDLYFYQFLSAYVDCEGCFKLFRSHETGTRFTFALKTCDKKILEQIQKKLQGLGFFVNLYLEYERGIRKGGYGKYNSDLYNLTVYRKKDVIRLCGILLSFSKHPEKVRKMNFLVEHKEKNWEQAFQGWNKIIKEIKKEVLKETSTTIPHTLQKQERTLN